MSIVFVLDGECHAEYLEFVVCLEKLSVLFQEQLGLLWNSSFVDFFYGLVTIALE